MKRVLPVILLLLSGCATSTGVMTIGDDTYSIARQDAGPNGSLGALKAETYKEATAFCAAKGKALKVITSNDVPRAFAQFPQTEVQFTCIEQ